MAAVCGLVGLATMFVGITPASADAVRRPYVSVLQPSGSVGPMVLDVQGGSMAERAPVQLWLKNGNSQQAWWVDQVGTYRGLPYYVLQNDKSGLCLDLRGDVPAANGGTVWQWTCNGGPNQNWVAVPVETSGSSAKWVELVNMAGQRCLDVKDVSYTNGALLQVWDCGGAWNQRFNIS